MKRLVSMILAVLLTAALVGCGSSPAGTQAANTTKGTPVTTNAQAPVVTEAQKLSGSVSTNGSTSMEKVIGILSEQFMNDNADVTVTYEATGSGTGIEAVANGTCDLGLASRNLKDAEREKGLTQTTVARDGIAIIVNANSPVENLSVAEIAAIFTGETTDWSAHGGNGAIACIGREANSGTRDGFESITNTTDKCVLAQELTSTGAVIAAVAGSENAIGYASFAAVEGQTGIKVLTVDGVVCTAENLQNGSYKIQRPFNVVTKEGVTLSPAAEAFFHFVKSAEAADLITKAGAVPTVK